ncbi:Cytochrome B5-like protein [Linum perenne]
MVIAVLVLILVVLLGAVFLFPIKYGNAYFPPFPFLHFPDACLIHRWSFSFSAVAQKGPTNANKIKAFRVYSKAEVSLHNKRTDCWIIVKDRVFDVTSYVEEHPGGDAILTNAGDDSTQGFYGPQHPGGAFQLIEDYCIGELEK